ncbi:MAG: HupE/UreJ family protein [Rhodobacteraceae bacterium]|nr:HupE/UreJ family protein [Paracoccaceae bacterium]
MRVLPLSLLLLLAPSLALAHPLHDTASLLAGAGHPLGGSDHLLAMLAVGLLAAQAGGRAIWALPAAFVGAMLAGGALGTAGIALAAVEPAILASAIVLGALVAVATRLPQPGLLAMTAFFGLAHGWAHGAEGPATGAALYAAGFALTTALLHAAGILLARGLGALALRGLGGAAAVAGLALAFV